jgi:hypothetical protein
MTYILDSSLKLELSQSPNCAFSKIIGLRNQVK